MTICRWLIFSTLVFKVTFTFAYSELTRFGYNTCMACHIAPSGGGALTPYGKNLSSEILSTWGSESEGGFLHGAINRESLEKWLVIGGDLRAAQVHKEDSTQKVGRFIKMQADLSLAVLKDQWATVLRIGDLDDNTWKALGTEFYFLCRPRDELSLRVGRFIPSYGLVMSDHIAFVRNFMEFGLEATRDSAEAQWTGEDWTLQVSAARSFGVDLPENIWIVSIQRYFFESSKIGINALQGKSDVANRQSLGLWGSLGFGPKVFWLFEVDQQRQSSQNASTVGRVSYQKFGYSALKGLDLLLLYETQQTDVSDPQTMSRRWGPGFQFYPRPHFELSGAWTKLAVQTPTEQESDYAWILFHYYL